MFLLPHAVVGVALAKVFPDPRVAIPLAFLSHFVLDLAPHWDRIGLEMLRKDFKRVSPKTLQIIVLDGLVSLSYALFFVYLILPDLGAAVTILFSALAAILPDLFYIPRAFFGKKWGWVIWTIKLQEKVHYEAGISKFFGLLTQAAVIAIGLQIALR